MQSLNPPTSFADRLQAYEQEALNASNPASAGKAAAAVCACSLAMGVVLGLAQPSLAGVHYSGEQNLSISGNRRDIAFTSIGDTGTDFFFFKSKDIKIRPNEYFNASSIAVAAYSTGGKLARKFLEGGSINTSVPNWQRMGSQLLNSTSAKGGGGLFQNATGYIGVRFHVDGDYHYGWIQYRGGTNGTGDILDWAWEDEANATIKAGDTVGTSGFVALPARDLLLLLPSH